MSKEIYVIDTPITDASEVVALPELIKLDDLSLAIVGGGAATVIF